MDRRSWIKTTAALGWAALAHNRTHAEERTEMLPVIDTHQHLWDLQKLKLGWMKPGHPLNADHKPEDYAKAIAGLNVVKSVYMEVNVVPEMKQTEANYVVELCKNGKSTMVAAVIGGDPSGDTFAEYITPYKGDKYVKGVRHILKSEDTPKGYCLKEPFVKGIQLLGELGLSFDLCCRSAELPDMTELVKQCPKTKFILDHCGEPAASFTDKQWTQWRTDMATLARQPNVVCKTSGFLANGYEKGKWQANDLVPAIDGTIDAFGIDRVMFGGDWPVVTLAGSYADWLGALRQVIAKRPDADQKKILHDNAARVYGI